MEEFDHPFFCVWCGEVLPDQASFEKHYAEELEEEILTQDEVFDLVHNENHY